VYLRSSLLTVPGFTTPKLPFAILDDHAGKEVSTPLTQPYGCSVKSAP